MINRITKSLLILSTASVFIISCSDNHELQQTVKNTLPFTTVTFSSLEPFDKTEAKNWHTVGGVYVNRHKEGHLETKDGSGILANLPDENNKAELVTSFDHQDIELEVDFMLPKGSNSGIYLQGRYELQLLDSWGKDSLTYGDCGGIYQRWNKQSDSGYEGTAPRVNACKAPGLWQHLKIVFQAPRFDDKGGKISNARFKKVILNDAIIHENVEVSGPTRGSFFEDEAAKGPIIIQGDHGPIAFRNLRYKLYEQDRIQLADMRYKFYQGEFDDFDTLSTLTPTKEEPTDSLTFKAAGDFDIYAIQFDGLISAPKQGNYLFDIRGYGPVRLMIDDQLVAENRLSQDLNDPGFGEIILTEGNHNFQLTFLKNERPWRRGLSVAYEGPEIPKTFLQARSSVPKRPTPDPIIVSAEQQVALQRGFLMHKNIKRTHAITVGTPDHINYALEISNGALLEGWRGEFIDATDMWHERGEAQLIQPLGSAQEFSAKPCFATLTSSSSDWPDSLEADNSPFVYKGYELSSLGIPTYQYKYDGILIKDRISPDTNIHGLTREVNISPSTSTIYCLLAEGKNIEKLDDGSYAVDDKTYYLNVVENETEPILREAGSNQQLIIALGNSNSESTLKYSLIW
ncbi:family 16 glycoside hydrolase [Catalinimonas alkaloidigena]|uniref:family 16 glycoside hydrolase n=1 Tax=Catalinimonas alkaloidigena TaxID=1075417 RepID=UPI002405E3DE|nr:family 16 glycoside hydrolase [Catalinimonas alkaloidigena]